MKEGPKISVIIPIYNSEDCLARCVNSVLRQTYDNLEILLVDDGSTDGSGKICADLAKADPRIRTFRKENGGSSSARNLGMSKATGEYLAFVDSDDTIDQSMYEILMQQSLCGGFPVVQISRDETDASGRRLPDVCVPPKEAYFCPSHDFLRELLLHRGDCSFCTKLILRDCLSGLSFPEGRLNEDFHLCLQLLSVIPGVYILPQQCYHVYYRPESNTRRRDREDFPRVYTDIVENADYATRLVAEREPDLMPAARRFGLYQRLEYLLHIPIGQMNKENAFYQDVKRYLRGNIKEICTNPYLNAKNRLYLLLLAAAPRSVRRLHRAWMGIRESRPGPKLAG